MGQYGSTETWVLVCDAGHARLLVNHGGHDTVHETDHTDRRVPKVSEIVANARGRNKNAAMNGRQAYAETSDQRRLKKEEFLKEVAQNLNEKEKLINRLVVVAPPKSLAVLRKELSPQLKNKVIGEIDKDLTHTSERELPQHLEGCMNIADPIHEFNYRQAQLFTAT